MQSPSLHKALSGRQANFALCIFLLAYILSFVDRQILSLMVDPIRTDLQLTDVQIGLLQGLAFALFYAFFGVPIGMLADRRSRKTIITVGIVLWSLATGMCGLAGSYAYLFAARMCVGLGEATLSPAAHSFLSDAFPRARLARAMAIYTLGITLGGGAALMIGGSVVDAIAAMGGVSVPLLGELRSWQAVFLLVSLFGIPVAVLASMTREPPRGLQTPSSAGAGAQTGRASASFGDVLHYLRSNGRAFSAIYASSVILGIMGYGMVGWYPTLLIRKFGLSPGDAGYQLGAIYLVLGSMGAICGGMLAERLALKGRADANMRVVLWAALAVLAPGTIAPLMPTSGLVLLFFAPACFFFNAYFGCAVAAIQLATPSHMRATNAALFLLANSLIGLTLGAVAVPLVGKLIFNGGEDLGQPLGVIAALSCTLAAISVLQGIKAYGELAGRERAPQGR